MDLQKVLYVKVEHDQHDPENDFLLASADPSDLSEAEATIEVGVYELVRTAKLKNETILEEN